MNVRVGLKQLADFPTLSWLYRPTVAGDADGTNLIRFGYDASRNLSVMTVPGYPQGGLIEFVTETTDDESFSLVDPTYGADKYFDHGILADLLVPGPQNKILALSYTSVGFVGWEGINTAAQDKIAGVIVYGVPTAAGDLPATGVVTYSLYGDTVDRPTGTLGEASISRALTGKLTVDYGRGTFAGSFGDNGRYSFGPAAVAVDGSLRAR